MLSIKSYSWFQRSTLKICTSAPLIEDQRLGRNDLIFTHDLPVWTFFILSLSLAPTQTPAPVDLTDPELLLAYYKRMQKTAWIEYIWKSSAIMLIIFISYRQAADLFVPHYWMQGRGNSFWKYFAECCGHGGVWQASKHHTILGKIGVWAQTASVEFFSCYFLVAWLYFI